MKIPHLLMLNPLPEKAVNKLGKEISSKFNPALAPFAKILIGMFCLIEP